MTFQANKTRPRYCSLSGVPFPLAGTRNKMGGEACSLLNMDNGEGVKKNNSEHCVCPDSKGGSVSKAICGPRSREANVS